MSALLLACLLAQQASAEKLAEKIDTQIEWITDGAEYPDNERRNRYKPGRDTVEVLEEALERAKERKRLVLWYVPRVDGRHMYRAAIPHSYAQQVFFTDPDVVALVNRKFVPMRAVADADIAEVTNILAWQTVEPAIVFLTPDGKVVHTIERIRTFNAGWLVEALRSVLRKFPDCNPVEENATVRNFILGGDYEKALAANPSLYQHAIISRRMRQGEGALRTLMKLDTAEAGVERGRVLLAMEKLDEAKRELTKAALRPGDRAAEALYLLGLAEFLTADEEKSAKRWSELMRAHPDSPWAWRAGACFVKGEDTFYRGAAVHQFDDPFWGPSAAYEGLPSGTGVDRGREEAGDVARRAVRFLLRAQRSNGGWEDSRYAYWPDSEMTPNAWVAISAVAATALLEWREIDPERVNAALAKAEKYFFDESRMRRKKNEEVYADAFKLLYLLRKHARTDDAAVKADCVAKMESVAKTLAESQQEDGFWAHEYPNSFCTAAALTFLQGAQTQAKAKIDPAMIARGLKAVESSRGPDGAQGYFSWKRPSSMKDSMGRVVGCDHALVLGGKLEAEDIRRGLENFWKHRDKLEAVRVCDFHTDGELGGFFFFHAVYFTCEGVKSLPAEERRVHLDRFLDWMVSIPELDGSFIDSHELGKSYGTGMALLILRNCVPEK